MLSLSLVIVILENDLLPLSAHCLIATIARFVWKDSRPSSLVADCKSTISWLCCAPCCEGLWGWRASTSQRWRQLILIITRTFSPVRLATKRATGPFFSYLILGSMASHTLARIQLPLPGWPPDLRSTRMNLSVWAKNWGLVNIPTTCFFSSSLLSLLSSCFRRAELHIIRLLLPSNDTQLQTVSQFGLGDAEITASTWTAFPSVESTSTSCRRFLFFRIFRLIFQPPAKLQSAVVKPSPCVNHNTDTC